MDTDQQRKILLARRADLLGEMAHIEDQLDDEPSKDWEDRSVERQGDEVLEALGQHDSDEVRRIDAALGRIADGSYGTCVKCGTEISEARLALLPDTPFCKDCAV